MIVPRPFYEVVCIVLTARHMKLERINSDEFSSKLHKRTSSTSPSCYHVDLSPIHLRVRCGPKNLLFHSKIHRKTQIRDKLECIPFQKILNATDRKKLFSHL